MMNLIPQHFQLARVRLLLLMPLLTVVLLVSTGCIRSKLNITSEPSGAAVTVNGETYGRTPVSVPFIWYWYYDVQLKSKGYETLNVRERMYAPPYFYIPLDLFFELLPFPVYDNRYRHYYMTPRVDY
jgi:hypothetical protein